MAPFIKDKRHLVGILLVLIGFVLIANNIRIIPNFIPGWIWTWQFLLITIGVFSLLTSDNSGPGIVLIGIGSVFLLSDILPDIWPGFLDWFVDDTNLFWYLILIVVGLSLLLRKKGSCSKNRENDRWRNGRPGFNRDAPASGTQDTTGGETYDNDYIDEVAIFGGGEKFITSNNFKGGKITAIFGGSDIILTHSQLAPGVNEIEVFAMFGGWTLRLPPNWQVKSEVVAVFGGISDKRYLGGDTIRDNSRQLIIKGFVMFGGGEIK